MYNICSYIMFYFLFWNRICLFFNIFAYGSKYVLMQVNSAIKQSHLHI